MATNVKFLKGTAESYANLQNKDAYTFYYTTDNSKLYLGTIELSTPAGVQAAIDLVNDASKGNNALKSAIDILNGAASVTGSVAQKIAAALEAELGTAELTTEASTIKGAINELDAAIDGLTTNSAVTVTESSSEDYAKVYTIAQGGTTKGTINIPKDMVVSSGRVVVDPDAEHVGTFIELTLANATSDKIYVNVGTLVDIYTAEQSAAQVQLAINSSTREISATIVAGSITSTELADNAVITAKIVDGAVTTDKVAAKAITDAKLSDEVNASLAKADSALQKADITTGTTNGTITVKGDEVAVAGLGSAAYANTTAFDEAGAAADVKSELEGNAETDTAASKTIAGAKKYADNLVSDKLTKADINEGTTDGAILVDDKVVNVHGLGGAAYKADNYYELNGEAAKVLGTSADTADKNTVYGAKAYADSQIDAALTWRNYSLGLRVLV